MSIENKLAEDEGGNLLVILLLSEARCLVAIIYVRLPRKGGGTRT